VELELAPKRYVALETQLIPHDSGVIVKRGAAEFLVSGAAAESVVNAILHQATQSPEGSTKAELVGFVVQELRDDARTVLDGLISRRLIVEAEQAQSVTQPESALDVFYWNFGVRTQAVREAFAARPCVIVGANELSYALVRSLREFGVAAPPIIDYPMLGNDRPKPEGSGQAAPVGPEFFVVSYAEWAAGLEDHPIDCIVATSDFGGLHWMREWNEVCVDSRLNFFPVVVQNYIGYIGPFVVPGQTACYECTRARQNSNMAEFSLLRAAEHHALAGQRIGTAPPSVTSFVAGVAAIELIKLLTYAIPGRREGQLTEANPLTPSVTHRRVLRLPRCTVCGPVTSPSTTTSRTTFMPGNAVVR
jgi:molybdopterin-synthase adenylyltransferase